MTISFRVPRFLACGYVFIYAHAFIMPPLFPDSSGVRDAAPFAVSHQYRISNGKWKNKRRWMETQSSCERHENDDRQNCKSSPSHNVSGYYWIFRGGNSITSLTLRSRYIRLSAAFDWSDHFQYILRWNANRTSFNGCVPWGVG